MPEVGEERAAVANGLADSEMNPVERELKDRGEPKTIYPQVRMDPSGYDPCAPQKPETEFRSICFFLDTGRTYTFRDADMIQDNETVWVIRYRAMSDGNWKEATFYKNRVAGIAKHR